MSFITGLKKMATRKRRIKWEIVAGFHGAAHAPWTSLMVLDTAGRAGAI